MWGKVEVCAGLNVNVSEFSAVETAGAVDLERETRVSRIYNKFTKRALDLVCVALVLPVVVPIVVVMALLVALDGHFPFYSQLRVGRGGRTFRIWKIRTMVPDADKVLETYLAAHPKARAEWDRTQKLRHDPRITRVGALLRRTSLDELPQIWNVLTGKMSLVGPRPMMTCQTVLYPGAAYYALRPGITGSWQVSDRNACSFAGRASFDEDYAQAVSLIVDLKILLQTLPAVLRCTGL